MKKQASVWLVATMAFLCLAAGGTVRAAYPEQPINIIVPFTPGGGTDQVSRTLAEGMSKALAANVIVVNKPGAGTVIGTNYVAKSKPDGYNIVMATFAHAANPSLHKTLPFSVEKDFAPIALIGTSPNILVVSAQSPYRSVQDVIKAATANPGKLTYGSFGTGTSAHLAGALFESLAKVRMTHVPYKGASPALTDVIGGQIDMVFSTAASVSQYLRSGQLRALAVTSGQRARALSDIPTIAESGVPGYAAESWYGLLAPAGTPDAVIQALHKAAEQAAASSVFAQRVEPEGIQIYKGPAKDLQDYIDREAKRWRQVVQAAGIKPD